ncbi:HesB/IscA family protein [Pararhodospirillum photometricum]|uniref:HesB/YadR/YfhF n=1 Tax=Pararhodospirillum photometricum DSM 122 TaxID=1150469 RepID=H6SS71_PARPM|nr:iron-sulfur cluster assembly accessory protein [Pararhodospirillum photometricum]CCG07750.1 HesB/YadR/YfhF [Pararhodospirillum photometricum DSM 122]
MMMSLSDRAADAVRAVVGRCADHPAGLRVRVSLGGCAGIVYRLGLERAAADGDHVIDLGSAKLFIDPESQPLIDGTTLDFVEEDGVPGFVFDNPKAAGLCSCGGSGDAPTCSS